MERAILLNSLDTSRQKITDSLHTIVILPVRKIRHSGKRLRYTSVPYSGDENINVFDPSLSDILDLVFDIKISAIARFFLISRLVSCGGYLIPGLNIDYGIHYASTNAGLKRTTLLCAIFFTAFLLDVVNLFCFIQNSVLPLTQK